MLLRVLLFSGLVFHKLVWEIWKRKYPSGAKFKPSTLVKRIVKLCKVAFLVFLLVQSLFLDIFPIHNAPPYLRYLGVTLFILGLCISISGRIRLGQNWADLEDQRVLPKQELVTVGIYHYIRHPIYLGDVFLVTGFELALNSWLFLLGFMIAMVVIRQAILEEKLLKNAFPEYGEYCMRTKRFLPFIV